MTCFFTKTSAENIVIELTCDSMKVVIFALICVIWFEIERVFLLVKHTFNFSQETRVRQKHHIFTIIEKVLTWDVTSSPVNHFTKRVWSNDINTVLLIKTHSVESSILHQQDLMNFSSFFSITCNPAIFVQILPGYTWQKMGGKRVFFRFFDVFLM